MTRDARGMNGSYVEPLVATGVSLGVLHSWYSVEEFGGVQNAGRCGRYARLCQFCCTRWFGGARHALARVVAACCDIGGATMLCSNVRHDSGILLRDAL
jgi:hypothetical protein